MINIEDVKRLTLGPDDLLVVQVRGPLSDETAKRIKAQFVKSCPQLENKLMVIPEELALAILIGGKAQAAA